MGQLAFVGLGLGDEQDLSPRARDRLRRCATVFAEAYTSVLSSGSLDRLAKELGRSIVTLPRDQVEAERPVLESLARNDHVGFLVVGDPFAATTHVALRLAAEAAGHRWSYLPNASILTAAPSFLGLQHYRFGRTVSVPFPAPGFAPRSPVDGIAENRARDLHTLVLLDLRPDEGRFLTANEALELLSRRDRESTGAVFSDDLSVAVAARIGGADPRSWYGPWEEMRRTEFGPPLHTLVVPARTLHFEEAEALDRVRTARRSRPS